MGQILQEWKIAKSYKERFFLVEGKPEKPSKIQRAGSDGSEKWVNNTALAR
jgi:hypothetical protein